MPIECSAIPTPRSLSPLSQYSGEVHSTCSECSICQELTSDAPQPPPTYVPKSSPKFTQDSSSVSSKKSKKNLVDHSPDIMVTKEGRSSFQSPLVGKRSPSSGTNGLLGGSSITAPPLPEIHIEEAVVCHKPPVACSENEPVKKKLSGKFKVKFTTKTFQNEDSSSHSSHESVSRKNSKRKKTEKKKVSFEGQQF